MVDVTNLIQGRVTIMNHEFFDKRKRVVYTSSTLKYAISHGAIFIYSHKDFIEAIWKPNKQSFHLGFSQEASKSI